MSIVGSEKPLGHINLSDQQGMTPFRTTFLKEWPAQMESLLLLASFSTWQHREGLRPVGLD
jgi:hypothetical protein